MGSYEPNVRIEALSTVVYRADQVQTLHCEQCSLPLSSGWYYVNPRDGHAKVLSPQSGHPECRRKFKRICHFVAADGSQKYDTYLSLDWCEHGIKRSACVLCGGCETCEHGLM